MLGPSADVAEHEVQYVRLQSLVQRFRFRQDSPPHPCRVDALRKFTVSKMSTLEGTALQIAERNKSIHRRYEILERRSGREVGCRGSASARRLELRSAGR